MQQVRFNDCDSLVLDGRLDVLIPSNTAITASITDRAGRQIGQFNVSAITLDHAAKSAHFRLQHAPLPCGVYYANVAFSALGFVSSCQAITLVINKSPTRPTPLMPLAPLTPFAPSPSEPYQKGALWQP